MNCPGTNTRPQSGTPSSASIIPPAQGIDESTIRDLSAGVYVGGADTVNSSYLPDRSIVIDCQILASRGASRFYSRGGAPPTRLDSAGGD